MKESEQQTYWHAQRETLVIVVVWVLAMVYVLTYCYLFGYPPADGQVRLVWGMPSWVFWGVVLPWLACDLITMWFCFWFMVEDDLGEDRAEEVGYGN